jgi:type II secretory pathway pseudopilin PulG
MRTGNASRGYAYMSVLVAIFVMGLAIAAVGQTWQAKSQRLKEEELLFIGEQYRSAIRQYYELSPGGKRYPPNLDDLLRDPRYPMMRRHLRRVYLDPFTNEAMEIITAPEGGIMGVKSRGTQKPWKQERFEGEQISFNQRNHYSDWEFVYRTEIILTK